MAKEAADMSGLPIQLSFPLPKAPDTRVYIHLTIQATSILLFLTTAMNGDTSTVPLGSFVYALPDRLNPRQTLSTPLHTYESSVDFTTRLAKLLAWRTKKAVYVGNSINFASAGLGGTIEEELEGFKTVVRVVMEEIQKGEGGLVNST